MVDCSRNGVLLVEACKFLLRQLALSGTNVLQVEYHFSRFNLKRDSPKLTVFVSYIVKILTRLKENLFLATFEVLTRKRN